jgi:hypothetical protein
MIDADVREVVVRFHSQHLLRSLDANVVLERVTARFANLRRVVFEPMSQEELAQAATTDADGIICVWHRLFVYARSSDRLARMTDIEVEVEQAGI